MEVLTHPGAAAVAQEQISCLVMSADDPAMHRRVEGALSSEGLEPRRHDNGSERIADGDLDPSAIIVLVCNVDAPREMATLRRLRREWRQPPIVVISPPATGTGVRRALEAGADAFVFESNLELTLAATVRAVASGQSVVPRKVRGSLERPALSHRERQVLALVAGGPHQRPDRQAALSLGEHDQEPPLFRLRQARRPLALGGRGAVPRARAGDQPGSYRDRRADGRPRRQRARHRMNSPAASATLPSAAANVGGRVPFIRLDETDPELFAELMQVVERVGRDGAFTLGSEVESFERDFAR